MIKYTVNPLVILDLYYNALTKIEKKMLPYVSRDKYMVFFV